jgi:hypothetical protein
MPLAHFFVTIHASGTDAAEPSGPPPSVERSLRLDPGETPEESFVVLLVSKRTVEARGRDLENVSGIDGIFHVQEKTEPSGEALAIGEARATILPLDEYPEHVGSSVTLELDPGHLKPFGFSRPTGE